MKPTAFIFLAILAAADAAAFNAPAFEALNMAARSGGYRAAAPTLPLPLPPVSRYEAAPYGAAEMGARLAAASERFLGVPYVLGPLGEGPDGEFDRGPLVSFTALDCTTFVEETMAFALGGTEPRALDVLRRIRYRDGRVGYLTRNHFTELDWLPNNIAAGFLKDITAEVAGARAGTVTKLISKREWYAKKKEADLEGFEWESPVQRQARLERFRALGAALPDQTAALAYVPLEALGELLGRIPSGTVVSIVREDRPDKYTLVSHQFFIFDGPGGKIVRHAAQGKKVLDVPAAQYLAGLANSSWRVLGLNLAAVK